jgi:Icc-related predicted phosphoesterase
MIIDCVGCLHGSYPLLEGGDLLIITGDLTARDQSSQYHDFHKWLQAQDYKKKIFICGNHDHSIEQGFFYFNEEWMGATFLNDSATEFEGLKIWGSPHSLWFEEINPNCSAFTGNESYIKRKLELIPDNIDILISHSPFYGILDENKYGKHCGSVSLREVVERVKPKLFVCSHIHEQGGNEVMFKHIGSDTWCVNCSIMDANYDPINDPIRIIL